LIATKISCLDVYQLLKLISFAMRTANKTMQQTIDVRSTEAQRDSGSSLSKNSLANGNQYLQELSTPIMEDFAENHKYILCSRWAYTACLSS